LAKVYTKDEEIKRIVVTQSQIYQLNVFFFIIKTQTQTIKVEEGDEMQIVLKAKRIAFSCFGYVRSLNNATEPFVGIEAIGTTTSSENETTKGYEETQTDNNGNYRLRGLSMYFPY
jgi:hypothetical protein